MPATMSSSHRGLHRLFAFTPSNVALVSLWVSTEKLIEIRLNLGPGVLACCEFHLREALSNSHRDRYFFASAQTGSPLSNTIRQVWGASSRQMELNRPATLSFTITGPVLNARSPDASTST
jgi:hypothetical protein